MPILDAITTGAGAALGSALITGIMHKKKNPQKITMEKTPSHGGGFDEWLIMRGGYVAGHARKVKTTKTDSGPYQAWTYPDQRFVGRFDTKAEMLAAFDNTRNNPKRNPNRDFSYGSAAELRQLKEQLSQVKIGIMYAYQDGRSADNLVVEEKRLEKKIKALQQKKNPRQIDKRRVRRPGESEKGTLQKAYPGGWVKVKWDDNAVPGFSKRDALKLARNPRGKRLDAFTKKHLSTWLSETVYSGDRKQARADIMAALFEYPDLIEKSMSWDQIRRFGERMRENGETKRNPSIAEVSESFQGRKSGTVKTFKAASSAPSDLARIGKLSFLKVAGKDIRITGAMVCADTKNKIWIAGARAPMLNQKARPGEGLDFGEITEIGYITSKAHIGDGKTFEYVHKFGEEGGRRPHLIIDSEGMPILRGGDYQIKAAGIID